MIVTNSHIPPLLTEVFQLFWQGRVFTHFFFSHFGNGSVPKQPPFKNELVPYLSKQIIHNVTYLTCDNL